MFFSSKWGFSAITVMPYSLCLSLSTPRAEKIALSMPTLILCFWHFSTVVYMCFVAAVGGERGEPSPGEWLG